MSNLGSNWSRCLLLWTTLPLASAGPKMHSASKRRSQQTHPPLKLTTISWILCTWYLWLNWGKQKKGGHRFGINFGTKTAAPFPACHSRNHCSMCWQLLRSRMMVLHTAIPASIAIRACKGITSLENGIDLNYHAGFVHSQRNWQHSLDS